MADASGLADEQLRALDRLKHAPVARDLYLAGGTAVARASADRSWPPRLAVVPAPP